MRASHLRRKHTEATKAKISALKSGINHPNFGKTFNDEFRAKLSASQKKA